MGTHAAIFCISLALLVAFAMACVFGRKKRTAPALVLASNPPTMADWMARQKKPTIRFSFPTYGSAEGSFVSCTIGCEHAANDVSSPYGINGKTLEDTFAKAIVEIELTVGTAWRDIVTEDVGVKQDVKK